VGAIGERDQVEEVWRALGDPKLHVVVQTAPAIRAALGECFGMAPGTRVTGKMVAALRRLGFDAVFDTDFSADLTIMEEGHELLSRLRAALSDGATGGPLPMFTSCCPAWIQFAENFAPDMLSNLSTCKSPQQMLGALAKSYYAEKIQKKPEEIFVVSVMPCTAKKFESDRSEMNDSGAKDVDVVLTTRELGRMIHEAGIDFSALPDEIMDPPLGLSTGAADIFANSGGVMEAALRTAYEVITGRPLPPVRLEATGPLAAGGVQRASLLLDHVSPDWSFLEGKQVHVAVVHGLAHARELLDNIRMGKEQAHFVEVMTCPGGCIGGGGQPRMTTDEVRRARMGAICKEDESKPLRTSHTNPGVAELYETYLGAPLGRRSHHLLHTHYHARGTIAAAADPERKEDSPPPVEVRPDSCP
jgi:iron-only hydrogenase group A